MSEVLASPDGDGGGGMSAGGKGRWLWWGGVALLFVGLCLTYLLRPIMEPDFYWHLKTGAWIWEHGALPTADPFSFTGPQQPDARQLLILRGYWLAQLLYHGMVSALGFWGILVLRVVLLAGFFALFLCMFERHRVNRLLALALLTLFGVFFLENYALERPQVFTFAAIALLTILYRRARERFPTATTCLPEAVAVFALLTVWGNLHGGVLLGQGALALMLVVETAVYARIRDRRRYVFMLLWIGVGWAGTIFSPSQLGLGEVMSLAGFGQQSLGGSQSQINYEYYSVIKWLFGMGNLKLLIPVAVSLLCLPALREAYRRRGHVEIGLLLVFWLFAYCYVRYLPIAMVFSLLFIAWYYRTDGLYDYLRFPLVVGAGLAMMIWTSNETGHLSRVRGVGLVDPRHVPVQAADFLVAQRYRGRILNPINWGGYLIWRLAPEIQIAADSRVLDEAVYEEVRALSGAAPGAGRPHWREYVDRHRVDAAIVPLMNGPRPSPLAQGFAADPDWQKVFSDSVSAVFVRRGTGKDSLK